MFFLQSLARQRASTSLSTMHLASKIHFNSVTMPAADGPPPPLNPDKCYLQLVVQEPVNYHVLRAALEEFSSGTLDTLYERLPSARNHFWARFTDNASPRELVTRHRFTFAGVPVETSFLSKKKKALFEQALRKPVLSPVDKEPSRSVTLTRLPIQFGCTLEDVADRISTFGKATYWHKLWRDRPTTNAYVKFQHQASADAMVKASWSDKGVSVKGHQIVAVYTDARPQVKRPVSWSVTQVDYWADPYIRDLERETRLIERGILPPRDDSPNVRSSLDKSSA